MIKFYLSENTTPGSDLLSPLFHLVYEVQDIPVLTREEKCPIWAQVENKSIRVCN